VKNEQIVFDTCRSSGKKPGQLDAHNQLRGETGDTVEVTAEIRAMGYPV
jgi:hypothetical protein